MGRVLHGWYCKVCRHMVPVGESCWTCGARR
jgi:hypothetical protein